MEFCIQHRHLVAGLVIKTMAHKQRTQVNKFSKKETLWHRCFPVHFMKSLRIQNFFIEHLRATTSGLMGVMTSILTHVGSNELYCSTSKLGLINGKSKLKQFVVILVGNKFHAWFP